MWWGLGVWRVKSQGYFASVHLVSSGLVAKISDFHPGFPDSIPGQELRSLQNRSLLSLRDHD